MTVKEYHPDVHTLLSKDVNDPLFIIVVDSDGEPRVFAPPGEGERFMETYTAESSKPVSFPNIEGAAWTVYEGSSRHLSARVGGTIYRWP